MTDRVVARAWTDRLHAAWSAADPSAMADLFTDDVAYRTSPFESPFIGRDAVVAHWEGELRDVTSVEAILSDPIVDGDRVVVEWWSVVSRGDEATTDAGVLILEFEGNRCASLTEYWMLRDGRLQSDRLGRQVA